MNSNNRRILQNQLTVIKRLVSYYSPLSIFIVPLIPLLMAEGVSRVNSSLTCIVILKNTKFVFLRVVHATSAPNSSINCFKSN
jgi:hypothetical protein